MLLGSVVRLNTSLLGEMRNMCPPAYGKRENALRGSEGSCGVKVTAALPTNKLFFGCQWSSQSEIRTINTD